MVKANPQPSVPQADQLNPRAKRFSENGDAVENKRRTRVPVFTLESAAGSVPALSPPRDAVELSRLAKEEKAEETIREMRSE